jgi:hypothetical protein
MSTVIPTTASARVSAAPKVALWTGRVLSVLPALFILSSGVNALTKSQQVLGGMTHLGYPAHTAPIIGVLALVSSILYLIPRTAVLGAILLTGYLGGAVASHLRVGDPTLFAAMFGVLLWGGLYLRDKRVRELIPFRSRVHSLPNESA